MVSPFRRGEGSLDPGGRLLVATAGTGLAAAALIGLLLHERQGVREPGWDRAGNRLTSAIRPLGPNLAQADDDLATTI